MIADGFTMTGLLVLIVVVLRALRVDKSSRGRVERRLGRRSRCAKTAGRRPRRAVPRPKPADRRAGRERRTQARAVAMERRRGPERRLLG